MITASMVLVALAAVALVAGLVRGGLPLIWLSIGLCLLAALLLGLGVLRLRPHRRDTPPTGANPFAPDEPSLPATPARSAEPADVDPGDPGDPGGWPGDQDRPDD